LQRVGRKNLTKFRVIVQEKKFAPKSGKIVAFLGFFDPHSKKAEVDVEAAKKYLSNGAQPTPRVQKIFTDLKITLPKWVVVPPKKQSKVKNPDKELRKNKPAEAKKETAPPEESKAEATPEEEKPEEAAEVKTDDVKAEKPKEEPKKDEKAE